VLAAKVVRYFSMSIALARGFSSPAAFSDHYKSQFFNSGITPLPF